MAQLVFRHGTMSSGKSLQILTVNHNYISQGKETLILKPTIDSRSTLGLVESRIGISAECCDIEEDFDIFNHVSECLDLDIKIDCILVEEAQFLTSEQVQQLSRITIDYDIPCLCYGLKNTFKENELFEGSKALLYMADKIEEIKTVCMAKNCTRKATHNLKVVNGNPVYSGETVSIGDVVGEDRYYSVCRHHYLNPNI